MAQDENLQANTPAPQPAEEAALTQELPLVPADVAPTKEIPTTPSSSTTVPIIGTPIAGVDYTMEFPAVEGQDKPAPDKPILVKGTVGFKKKKDHRKLKKRLLIGFIIFLLLAIGGTVAAMTYNNQQWGGKVLDDVVGIPLDEASALLGERGFTIDVVEQLADEDIGNVIAMNPLPGQRIRLSQTVTLTVAIARIVPNVIDMTVEDAQAKLEALGAQDIAIQYEASSKPQGTVLSVSPEVGKPFKSGSTVTLTVAQPFSLPDVVGLDKDEAIKVLADAGFEAICIEVASDLPAGAVVGMDPAAGTTAAVGTTVTLQVSSPYPSDVYHLLAYFGCASSDLSSYLISQGFTMGYGADSGGYAETAWVSGTVGSMTFTSHPNTRRHSSAGSVDVLAGGLPFTGIRLDLSTGNAPVTLEVSRECMDQLVEVCALGEITDIVTPDSLEAPAGTNIPADVDYIGGSGKTGTVVWSVVIVRDGGVVSAAVSCGTESLYDDIDLAPYGDSLANYLVYTDLFAA